MNLISFEDFKKCKLKQFLTSNIPLYSNPGKYRKIEFFRESEFGVYIPRNFRFFFKVDVMNAQRTGVPLGDACKFTGTLQSTSERPQVDAFEKTVDVLEKKKAATLILPCGTGKTVVALAVAARLKVRTCIICHKAFLLDQWSDRIKSFVHGVKIGVLKQKTSTSGDFILASLQSLVSRDYGDVLKDVGLVIVDECHHVPSASFAVVLSRVNPMYTFGLTATPKRGDHQEKFIFHFLGDISFSMSSPSRQDVTVQMIRCATEHLPFITNRAGMPNYPTMITKITENLQRNNLILDRIEDLYSEQPNRKGLLLTDRVYHASELFERLRGRLGEDICDIYTGKIKSCSSDNFAKFLTISTYGLFAEAVDFSGDFLVLSTPRSNIEQACGRIMRGRQTSPPLIMDFVDLHFQNMTNSRKKLYKKKNYSLQLL